MRQPLVLQMEEKLSHLHPGFVLAGIIFAIYAVHVLGPVTTSMDSAWKYVFLTTVLISTLIQLHSSTSIHPFMWNGKSQALVDAPERKWDWGDLQFLRGFCKNDPLEGRAPAYWLDTHD